MRAQLEVRVGGSHLPDNLLRHRPQVERRHVERHLAALDARDVQEVLYELRHTVYLPVYDLQRLHHLLVALLSGLAREDLRVSLEQSDRRLELMRGNRKELVAQPERLPDLLLRQSAVRDVVDRADHPHGLATLEHHLALLVHVAHLTVGQ